MSDNVTLFPNLMQPVVALKTYAPLSLKFWENQGTALEGMKEFSDGWFARRHKTTQAGIEAVLRKLTQRSKAKDAIAPSASAEPAK